MSRKQGAIKELPLPGFNRRRAAILLIKTVA